MMANRDLLRQELADVSLIVFCTRVDASYSCVSPYQLPGWLRQALTVMCISVCCMCVYLLCLQPLSPAVLQILAGKLKPNLGQFDGVSGALQNTV